MEKEEIRKAAEQELQWLKYYATHDSRKIFDPTKPVYAQLTSASYLKDTISARAIPLQLRCSSLRITSTSLIQSSGIEEMVSSNEPFSHENNVYTALEVYALKYPDEHAWIIESLQ